MTHKDMKGSNKGINKRVRNNNEERSERILEGFSAVMFRFAKYTVNKGKVFGSKAFFKVEVGEVFFKGKFLDDGL